MVHAKRREIFSLVLWETISNHIATAKMQQEFLKGHYNYIVQSYLLKIQKNVGSKACSKGCSIKTKNDHVWLEELLKILDESKPKSSGAGSSSKSSARKREIHWGGNC
jgi:hypothetical protein